MEDYYLFYKDKTVLVTGGAGAIGSNLTKALASAGAKCVIVLDNFSSSYKWNIPDYPNVMLVEDGGAAAVLLSDVSSLAVQTYDESNAALAASLSGAACDDIRRVAVAITIERSGVTETLRTKLFLRCTMAGAGG